MALARIFVPEIVDVAWYQPMSLFVDGDEPTLVCHSRAYPIPGFELMKLHKFVSWL